jgi:hypothetical protein
MATTDVPGSNPAAGDELKVGCWAEHTDGSLIFVEGFENGTVTYSIFDTSTEPITEYRDAMPEKGFRDLFVDPKSGGNSFLWHDKTPFPWVRVVKAGAQPGQRFASASDQLSAAERLARSLNLRSRQVEQGEISGRAERMGADPSVLKQALNSMEGFIRALKDLVP